MDRRVGVLGVGAVAAVAIIAALVVHQSGGRAGAGLFTTAPGPRGESYVFNTDPVGRGGPANDCIVCHSVEKNGPLRSAPTLWGIVGAPKARSDWFAYSTPLRRKGGTWTEDELDKYLANPAAFIPGTIKTLPPIEDPARRRDVIMFLKSLQG
jgi:cytochrome c